MLSFKHRVNFSEMSSFSTIIFIKQENRHNQIETRSTQLYRLVECPDYYCHKRIKYDIIVPLVHGWACTQKMQPAHLGVCLFNYFLSQFCTHLTSCLNYYIKHLILVHPQKFRHLCTFWCRAGHFRYFLTFSIIRNDILHYLAS